MVSSCLKGFAWPARWAGHWEWIFTTAYKIDLLQMRTSHVQDIVKMEKYNCLPLKPDHCPIYFPSFSGDPLPPLIKTHSSSDAATFVYVNIFVRSFSKIDDVKMVGANISSQVIVVAISKWAQFDCSYWRSEHIDELVGSPRLMMWSRGIAVRHQNDDLHIIFNAMHHNKTMHHNAQRDYTVYLWVDKTTKNLKILGP